MSKTLTAILIDPFACEVKEIQLPDAHDASILKAYYAALSHETHPVTYFDAARAGLLRGRDVIFVDDEGLLQPRQRYFLHVGYHMPLAGKGLIVGATRSGDAKSAETKLSEVQRCTVFLKVEGKHFVATTTPWTQKAAAIYVTHAGARGDDDTDADPDHSPINRPA